MQYQGSLTKDVEGEMSDLNQIWADEMNGKVPPGTYKRAFKEKYPAYTDEKIHMMELEAEVTRLKERIKDLTEELKEALEANDTFSDRVKELKEGIRKHKETLHGEGKTWEWGGKASDEELYKLLGVINEQKDDSA